KPRSRRSENRPRRLGCDAQAPPGSARCSGRRHCPFPQRHVRRRGREPSHSGRGQPPRPLRRVRDVGMSFATAIIRKEHLDDILSYLVDLMRRNSPEAVEGIDAAQDPRLIQTEHDGHFRCHLRHTKADQNYRHNWKQLCRHVESGKAADPYTLRSWHYIDALGELVRNHISHIIMTDRRLRPQDKEELAQLLGRGRLPSRRFVPACTC
ncbi:hypothetical protein IWX48DRAFT_671324, partial [Phyllosticta citricarpa]